MKSLSISILPIVVALAISGCGSTGEKKEVVSIENDPRIGQEVKSVCSIRSIRGWQHVDNDRDALIVKMPRDKSYKLSLMGFCDAEWAMTKIAVVSKTGSQCMHRGDKVLTDSDVMASGACTIHKIQEWYPEKLAELNKENTKSEVKKVEQ